MPKKRATASRPANQVGVGGISSTAFGVNGDYLLHASTLNYLLKYYDFKAVVLA